MGVSSSAAYAATRSAWTPANDPALSQILLLDPDPTSRETLSDYLGEHGFAVQAAFQPSELDAIMRTSPVDVVIVNVGKQADAGLSLCRRMHGKNAPRLIMAGMFDATDRILALELGADDYLSTPYNPREMLARVKAVLRRARPVPAFLEPGRRHFLGLRFDFGIPMLQPAEGQPITLTPGEFALLSVFLAHPGRVLSRDELLDKARGETDVFDRVIDVQVSRLRSKLARHTHEQAIRTHRHSGYQFVARVH